MRTWYVFITVLFLTVHAAAHQGPHNASNAHTTQQGDPVAVAAIVTGLLILAGLTWYAAKEYRRTQS